MAWVSSAVVEVYYLQVENVRYYTISVRELLPECSWEVSPYTWRALQMSFRGNPFSRMELAPKF